MPRNRVNLSKTILSSSEFVSMPLGAHLVLFVSLHRVGGAPRGGAPEPPGRFLCCSTTVKVGKITPSASFFVSFVYLKEKENRKLKEEDEVGCWTFVSSR